MAEPTKTVHGLYSVYFAGEALDPSVLTGQLPTARRMEGKGREGIRVLETGSGTLACRKYVHGGLLRALTRDMFFSSLRALREMEITTYLLERGFPVVRPFAVIVEKRCVMKRLYFLTLFEEGAADLLGFLGASGRMTRLRMVRRLAESLWRLETLGVYHPDLHLNNVLVTAKGAMVFLDFDKSRMGRLTKRDLVRMVLRLNRFAEKMERRGGVHFNMKDKMLFLRTYRRLSGYDILSAVERRMGRERLMSRVGWFIEDLLYPRRGN